ncbi:uncharacterized protein LOC8043277 [Ixodes scapularis]|uniref:uncharacterized protein LOC8043277 n=1 Tax=Ixodes scapularis TaxID=6945 RepID=UPI001A9EF72D|nr:uncharacterized protein LOC8043277 [Ixodes scapularis]
MPKPDLMLIDWGIKPSGVSTMKIEARAWDGTTRGKFFVTADVKRRIDATHIQCVDGLAYELVGDFDYDGGAKHGLPTRILDSFAEGIPEEWVQVITGWSEALFCATSKKINTNVRSSDENRSHMAEQQASTSKRAAAKGIDMPEPDRMLIDWGIKPSGVSTMKIEARAWDGTTRGKFFVTADVKRRIDATHIQCVDGLAYELVGDFDYDGGAKHGLPTRILDSFAEGIPEEWVQVIPGWSEAVFCATSKKINTNVRSSNEKRCHMAEQQASTSKRAAAREMDMPKPDRMLIDWGIKPSGVSTMQIEAYDWNGTSRGNFLRTSDVQLRISSTRVQCVDSRVYELVGKFDHSVGYDGGIPTRILNQFMCGVPREWVRVITGWSEDEYCEDKRCSSGSEENNEPEATTLHHSATTSWCAGADSNGVEQLHSSTIKLIEAGHGKGKGEPALSDSGAKSPKSRTSTGRAEKWLKGKLETDSATVEGQEQSINTPVQRSRQLQKAIPHQGNKTLHLEAVHVSFQDDDRSQSSFQKNGHSQQAPPVTDVQPSLQRPGDAEKAKEYKVPSEGRTHPLNTRQADKIRTLSRQISNLPSAQKGDRNPPPRREGLRPRKHDKWNPVHIFPEAGHPKQEKQHGRQRVSSQTDIPQQDAQHPKENEPLQKAMSLDSIETSPLQAACLRTSEGDAQSQSHLREQTILLPITNIRPSLHSPEDAKQAKEQRTLGHENMRPQNTEPQANQVGALSGRDARPKRAQQKKQNHPPRREGLRPRKGDKNNPNPESRKSGHPQQEEQDCGQEASSQKSVPPRNARPPVESVPLPQQEPNEELMHAHLAEGNERQVSKGQCTNPTVGSVKAHHSEIPVNPWNPLRVPVVVLKRLDPACLQAYCKPLDKVFSVGISSISPCMDGDNSAGVEKKASSKGTPKNAGSRGERTARGRSVASDAGHRKESDCTKGHPAQPKKRGRPKKQGRSRTEVSTTGDEVGATCSGPTNSKADKRKRRRPRKNADSQQKENATPTVAITARKGTLKRRLQVRKANEAIAAAAVTAAASDDIFGSSALTMSGAIPPLLFLKNSAEEWEDAVWAAADTPHLASSLNSSQGQVSGCSSVSSMPSSPDLATSDKILHCLKKSMKADGKKSCCSTATPKGVARRGPVGAKRLLKELQLLEGQLQKKEEKETRQLQSDEEQDYYSSDNSSSDLVSGI